MSSTTDLTAAGTLRRVRAACCDESTVDLDTHALRVTRLAREARAVSRRNLTERVRRELRSSR